MKNKKYHTVGTVPKYHTVGTVPKYHTVRTLSKYHNVGTVPKSNRKIKVRIWYLNYKALVFNKHHVFRTG